MVWGRASVCARHKCGRRAPGNSHGRVVGPRCFFAELATHLAYKQRARAFVWPTFRDQFSRAQGYSGALSFRPFSNVGLAASFRRSYFRRREGGYGIEGDRGRTGSTPVLGTCAGRIIVLTSDLSASNIIPSLNT
jgi:hypothetical protein